jgi:hypothetical protein
LDDHDDQGCSNGHCGAVNSI